MDSNEIMSYRFKRFAAIGIMQAASFSAYAEWELETQINSYYTDNVGLFSVTRRLSLEEDPTQPMIDEPEQSSDFVYEPRAGITWKGENGLGDFAVGLNAGAYIFQDRHDYTHGFYELNLTQALTPDTEIKFFYDFIPDLFLGENRAFHELNEEFEADETLDSHIWALHLDHMLTKDLKLRALTRFGIRRYDELFAYRDTHFFTIGPHLEWMITPDVELMLGYHFERGYADGKKVESFHDDVSYINHYTSAELKAKILPKLTMMLIFDYEHNDLLSDYVNDIHHDGKENVFQGEVEFLYEILESATVKLGWQYGTRKFSFEEHSVRNNNLWLGLEYRF